MPKISDLKPKNKGFKKSNYSPWDNSPFPTTDTVSIQDDIDTKQNTQNKELFDEIFFENNISKRSNTDKGVSKGGQQGDNKGVIKEQDVSQGGQEEDKEGFSRIPEGVIKDSTREQERVNKDDKKGPKLGSELDYDKPNFEDNKDELDKQFIIESLVGAQKKIMYFIVEICSIKGTLMAPPTNIAILSERLTIPKQTVKTAIKRLVQKGLLYRGESRKGTGGFSCFKISESTKTTILSLKENRANNSFLNINSSTTLGTEIGLLKGSYNNVVSSSNINTTTYNKNILPEDWHNIDFSSLEDVGFSEEHLIQIFKAQQKKPETALAADNIQNSIYAMAFDIKHNNAKEKANTSVVGMLTAMLKKGDPYSSTTPEKYLSPKAERMKQYLAAQKKEIAQLVEMEAELLQMKFDGWKNSLSSTKRAEILKQFGSSFKFKSEGARKTTEEANLKDYFRDNFWEKEKQNIPGLS